MLFVSCGRGDDEYMYNYIHNQTNQNIRLNNVYIRKYFKNTKGKVIKPNEKIEIIITDTDIRGFIYDNTEVFTITFEDDKILAYKWALLNGKNVHLMKRAITSYKSWKNIGTDKYLYEITEEDYKQAEYLTYMRYGFLLDKTIPEDYRKKGITRNVIYYNNGTKVEYGTVTPQGYYYGYNYNTPEYDDNFDYFAKGKNNFVVPPVYTDSCTIIFNVKDKFGNDTPKKILKYSGRYDNATRHSPLHKKYWTKQSDTEYYYTITREDFEAAEDL